MPLNTLVTLANNSLFKSSSRIHLWMFGRELDSGTCAIKVGRTEPFTGVSVLIFEFRRLEWDKLPYVHNDTRLGPEDKS